MNGGLAVISDVPKTRVYSLCRWLNSEFEQGKDDPRLGKEIIPVNIINKAPSAELKPGQLDQDSLPAYDVLDEILQRFIEHHESAQQIIAAGHDEAVVKRVVLPPLHRVRLR